MFGFGGVFGRKPRQFDYKPRYYDADKEAMEQRKRAVLGNDYAEKYMTDEQKEEARRNYKPGAYLRTSMMDRRGIGSSRGKGSGTVIMRLVIIAVLLIAAVVWVLNTDSIDNLFIKWLAE